MKRWVSLFGVALIISLSPAFAYAAPTDNIRTMATPIILALAIAYVTRRMAIGGWLFYYYLMVFAPLFLFAFFEFEYLNPDDWKYSGLYAQVILPTILLIVLKVMEFFVAVRLLFKSQRNSQNVLVLRYVLIASVVAWAIDIIVDYNYYKDDLAISVFGFTLKLIWMLYFYFSSRVNYVLCNWPGSWDYQSFKTAQAKPS